MQKFHSRIVHRATDSIYYIQLYSPQSLSFYSSICLTMPLSRSPMTFVKVFSWKQISSKLRAGPKNVSVEFSTDRQFPDISTLLLWLLFVQQQWEVSTWWVYPHFLLSQLSEASFPPFFLKNRILLDCCSITVVYCHDLPVPSFHVNKYLALFVAELEGERCKQYVSP